MALIQPSISINQIVGSAGSNTFSRNKGGNYVKIRKTSANPRTGYQTNIRNLFAATTEAWRTLSDAQRTGWNNGAVNFPYQNKFGDTKYYSGQQLFNKLNANLNAAGYPNLSDCPSPYTFGSLDEFTMHSTNHGSLSVDIVVSTSDANAVIEVWCSPPVSAGVKYFSPSTYKLIGVCAYANQTALSLMAWLGGRGINPAVGQRIGLKIVPISRVSGQASTPLFTTCIVT